MSDHQPKIDCDMHRVFYMNLVVTTNQKPVIYTHKIKRKESKNNTESYQAIREESKKTGRGKNYKSYQSTV